MARGKPFTKGDPRIAQGHKVAGRKKTPPEWKEMADELRLTIVRLLSLEKNDLTLLLQSNPTGVEMLAAKYIHENAVEAVNRFLGKVEDRIKQELTGKDGASFNPPALLDLSKLTPEELLKLIEATK